MKAPYLRVRIDTKTPGRSINASEIVKSLHNEIISNPHALGSRLPPVRVLAHQLGISKNTVHSAYEELVSRDLVINKERQGFFVKETPDAKQTETPLQTGQATFRNILPVSSVDENEFINLSNVFIDPDLLPNKKLTDCFRSILSQPGLGYMYNRQGYTPLRETIAQRLSNRGIPANADDIVITTGSQQALDIVCRAIQGNHFAVENPTYSIGKQLLEMNQCKLTGLPLNPFNGIDLDQWETLLKTNTPDILYLISSFHNPTGYSYTTQELQGILTLSQKYNFGLLEDDWGSDMLSFSEYKPPLRAFGGDRVLYMNSFTKKLLPSLRIGYLLSNQDSIHALLEAKRVSTLGNPSLMEAALFEFLDRGYYDSHLKQLQTQMDQRYQNCIENLRNLMPDTVTWTTPGGGPILWLEVPQQLNFEHLQQNLSARKIVIRNSLNAFSGPPHLHGFLIGYAYLKDDRLNQGLTILAEEIKKLL